MKTSKKILAVFLWLVIAFSVRAQAPDLMSYQAVIRNTSNNLVVNKTVGVKISILKGGVNGAPVYVETHTVQTNVNGMISLYIGNGQVSQGVFSAIDWSSGLFFIKTETDPNGGSNYVISGTSQLLSVPYALYAKSAGNSFDGDYNKLTNAPVLSQVAKTGSYNDLTDVPEKQQLSISGNTISLTEGGSVQLPVSFDGDFNGLKNLPDFKKVATSGLYSDLEGIPEKQTLSIKEGKLEISGGDYLAIDPEFFKLPDGFSGKYADLLGVPGKQKLGIKDGKLVLEGKEGEFGLLELDAEYSALPEGFSGNYDELLNKPVKQKLSIKENKLVLEGGNEENTETLLELGESVELPAGNSFSGNYDDLENKPVGNNEGDILYWANNSWTILPIGQEGQVLSVANGKLTWIEPSFANTSASTYKVGDVYYNREGIPEGVVIEVSTVGRYGKILSLKEVSEKAWSTGSETTDATDATDGTQNMAIIKGMADWQTKFPAFAAVAEEGEQWYLPAANEWLAIYENKQWIEEQLSRVNGQPFSGQFYWSSTESVREETETSQRTYATGIAMKEYTIPAEKPGKDPVNVLPGESFDDRKVVGGAVRAIRRLSWAETTSKPVAGETYAVGDLYYASGDKENPIGVVYAVTDGGVHGKVISFDETSLAWSTENVLVGASSADDGAANSAKISGMGAGSEKYPANAWCTAKGQGWYMPSVSEMSAIREVQYLLNVTLGDNGKTQIAEGGSYWTSTEVDDKNSYTFVNASEPASPTTLKSEQAKVRAVYAF